ncbi:MAG: histidine kinase [Gemmatimonadaceae bacterium]
MTGTQRADLNGANENGRTPATFTTDRVMNGSERTPLSRSELLLILAFWTFMATLSAANGLLDPRDRIFQPVNASSPVMLAFIESYLWAMLTPGIFLLAERFGLQRSKWLPRLAILVGAGLLIAIMADSIHAWLRYSVFYTSSVRPPPSVGPWVSARRFFFLNDFMLYIAVLSAGVARAYSVRYRARQEDATKLRAEAAQLQTQLAEARLAALRSQLDPHFLFNTLHAVSSLVERDPKGVRRMIARLSELLRHRLESNGEQETTLEEELDFVARYLEIMQIRFQGKLEVVTEVEPEARIALVPNLILQPLVENALKHGVGRSEAMGHITIRARRVGDRIVLSVQDNGPGLGDAAVPPSEGVGLSNSRGRLAHLYGSEQSLELRPVASGGVVAEVSLPYHTAADLRIAGVSEPEGVS